MCHRKKNLSEADETTGERERAREPAHMHTS